MPVFLHLLIWRDWKPFDLLLFRNGDGGARNIESGGKDRGENLQNSVTQRLTDLAPFWFIS